MRRDVYVKITLLETAKGGRKEPIPSDAYLGLMMFDDQRGYDFRANLFGPLAPGDSRELDVAFLSPDEVAQRTANENRFIIWAGRSIGEGTIIESFI